MNFDKLNQKLQGRCFESRKLQNNTYAIRHPEYLAIKLHNTEILKYYKNNDIVIDVDGWQTMTSKERLNYYLDNCKIYKRNSIWYISFNNNTYYYKDGIIINGNNINAELYDKNQEREIKKLKKSIRSYCNKFTDLAISGKLEKPSGGDCWYCIMNDKDGNIINNKDHIISHIKENYFVPSLFWNAMNFYKDNFALIDKHNLHCIHHGIYDYIMIDVTKERMKKCLTKFIYKSLNMAY